MTSAGGLTYDRYDTAGSQEWLMRIGRADAPSILIVPPLFEEMNRTRSFIATIMRFLAQRGHGCWLPDLPGTGESERALEDVSWSDWRNAAEHAANHVRKASGSAPLMASIRGGALLDDTAGRPAWRFAPADGASLARDLSRASMVKQGEISRSGLNLAGYPIPEALFSDLKEAKPAQGRQLRTVRLASDRAEADLKVEGPALWRRSEPANSLELAAIVADDLASWSRQCAAC